MSCPVIRTQGVDGPQGFLAAGIRAGIKKSGQPDLALVVNTGPQYHAAGVFTRNQVKAAPVIWTHNVVTTTSLKAVLLNSGCANACTGHQGLDNTRISAHKVAQELTHHHIPMSFDHIGVCSTGLIGEHLPMEAILAGIPSLVQIMTDPPGSHPEQGGNAAAQAIMTTDTVAKQAYIEFTDNPQTHWSIGAMAKGAGMIAPSLATMLAVITTDALVSNDLLDQALRQVTALTFDRLDIDGCCSTNDTVLVLASGASRYQPKPDQFAHALYAVCDDLAQQMQQDAEGVTKRINITVTGAPDESCALHTARVIARDNLVKTALFGSDPNWGRVLAAIGMVNFPIDPHQITVSFNNITVFDQGTPILGGRNVDLSGKDIHLVINLGLNDGKATIRTTDLSHAYVEENSAYSS